MMGNLKLKLNETAYRILDDLGKRERIDTFEFETITGRVRILDLGVNANINDDKISTFTAEASMGGLGTVRIKKNYVHVEIAENPAIATMSCQLAGWAIRINSKRVPGSGPARILARKPREMIDRIGYYEVSEKAALLLETDRLPDDRVCNLLDEINSKELIIGAFSANSRVGVINILSRVVEVALFRLYSLGYDVRRVISAEGTVPIPKDSGDIMFASNDAIIYSSIVVLSVDGWNPQLTDKAVSSSSRFYGKRFKEIFQEVGDFYNIDPEIFSPAELRIVDVKNNVEHHAGGIRDF